MPSACSSTPASGVEPTSALDLTDGGFGLYVHWPFCQSKCPYCDFNSHVRETVAHDRWAAALVREIEAFAEIAPARPLDTIFFGGGTPSLMQPETVSAVIEAARRRFGFANAIEITAEANPGSVEAGRFREFATAGVNRVSLGVQALDDESLRFLGRRHTVAEALAALEIAHDAFDRVSFDLIYARPGQTVDAWERELDRALTLAREHLSLYQLTIEPGTAFHGLHARGAFALPAEDDGGAMYEATQARLAGAGLPAYEISNHAAPGQESRHNLIYWRQGQWIGVGPGAHGRFDVAGVRTAFRQVRTPEAWLSGVEAQGRATTETEALAAGDIAVEALMMGLRLVEGVDRARFQRLTGEDVTAFVDAGAVARLIDGGFVRVDDARFAATAAGRQRLDAVLAMLLPA